MAHTEMIHVMTSSKANQCKQNLVCVPVEYSGFFTHDLVSCSRQFEFEPTDQFKQSANK